MEVIGRALGFDSVTDARAAEAMGYDGVCVVDHFFSGLPPSRPTAVPHAFVSLGAVAAVTDRVLLTQTMVAATMRHPFEVAQAIACLDRLSNGRAELGVGSGWLQLEHDAMGLAFGSPRQRITRVVEAIEICRQMFRQRGCVDFEGTIFRAHSEAPWPETPHVPKVMAGAHGRTLLRRLAPIVDRIDLLESMGPVGPNFDGDHLNDETNLASRIALVDGLSNEGQKVRFSATVNIVVEPNRSSCRKRRAALAATARFDIGVLDRELLRMVVTEQEALNRFAILAKLGIDRVHVRAGNADTQHWLDAALPDLQALE